MTDQFIFIVASVTNGVHGAEYVAGQSFRSATMINNFKVVRVL